MGLEIRDLNGHATPFFVCDVCHEVITSENCNDGIATYAVDYHGEPQILRLTHKGKCDTYPSHYSIELSHLLVMLMQNSGLRTKKAKDMAEADVQLLQMI